VYVPPEEQDPQDLAWMREALIMVSYGLRIRLVNLRTDIFRPRRRCKQKKCLSDVSLSKTAKQ
jgi:hypothetical protein